MKHYETIFIITPNLGDEEYGETLSKFRDLIDKSNSVIVKVDEWGKQKLAYALKKFDSGFYVLVDYCGDPELIVELERGLKLDERILKYQTVKLADKADPEALIREAQETSEKRPKKPAEVTSKGEKGASIGREGAAEADRSAKAEGSAEADGSAKADSPVEANKSPEVDEKSVKPGEDSAEADKSPEVDEKSVKPDEGSAQADESAKEDEVPQKETAVQTEGEKKS